MKYDCDLIRDVVPLYKDRVLSDKSEKIVDEHLAECPACKKIYDEYSDERISASPMKNGREEEVTFAIKIKEYRLWQIGMFVIALLPLLAMVLPWFGHQGIDELTGTVVLRHPLAIVGLGLFLFAIWYNCRKTSIRLLCGYMGFGLLLIAEIYDFFTIPCGSTVGLQIAFFHYDVPSFHNLNVSDCLENAAPGFYIGISTLLLAGVLFFFFLKKIKKD